MYDDIGCRSFGNYEPIPPAPTFEPSEDEFKDPLYYINKIRPIGENYGIIKIKPPTSWQPPFAIDIDKFKFIPRIQRLNELDATSRVRYKFLDSVVKFWNLQGSNIKIPTVDGRPVDLYLFHTAVKEAGGFDIICQGKGWPDLAMKLKTKPQFAHHLKQIYQRILMPFDVYQSGQALEHAKSGKSPVKIQSVSTQKTRSCMKGRCGNNLQEQSTEVLPNENETEGENITRELRRLKFLGAGPKYSSSSENLSNVNNGKLDSVSENGNKRKRERNSASKQAAGSENDDDPMASVFCGICEGGEQEEQMLLCDSCESAYHTFCLLPPLKNIPRGDWRCPECITQEVTKTDMTYGFEQACREYTLHSFGEMADRFKQNHFGMPCHLVPLSAVEREFWRLVHEQYDSVTVEYGADLLSQSVGSGFPHLKNKERLNAEELDYARAPWNLNNLPALKNSMLSALNIDISGMKVPWIYVGMCFATFCWHTEDHWSYSINYLHWGEPKTWYGVPRNSAEKFEEAMKELAPELFQAHPDLLHHIVTIADPRLLMKKGVTVSTLSQCAGEFVVTFPRAFHSGFNQGYNCAEAVNFAPSDWLPVGRLCIDHYAEVGRLCVFAHDELVCKLALDAPQLDVNVAAVVYKDMLCMLEKEKDLRRKLLDLGIKESARLHFELINDDERQCCHCKTTCFLSSLTCPRCPGKMVCLNHVKNNCDHESTKYCLKYRYTLDEMPAMLQALRHRAESFDRWANEVRRALDTKSPDEKKSLEELRALQDKARIERIIPTGGSSLLDQLNKQVKHAERCVQLSQKLVATKIRTRCQQRGEANYSNKLKLYEVVTFKDQLSNLVCTVPELDIIQEFITRVYEFQAEAATALQQHDSSEKGLHHLEILMERAISFDLQLDELPLLKKEIELQRWIFHANRICNPEARLNCKFEITLEVLRDLIEEGVSLCGCQGVEEVLSKLQTVLDTVEIGEQQAKEFYSSDNVSFESASTLFASIPSVSGVRSSCVERLSLQLQTAKKALELIEEIQRMNVYCLPKVEEVMDFGQNNVLIHNDARWLQMFPVVSQLRDAVEELKKLFIDPEISSHPLAQLLKPREDLLDNPAHFRATLPRKFRLDDSVEEFQWLNDYSSTNQLREYLTSLSRTEKHHMLLLRSHRSHSRPGSGCFSASNSEASTDIVDCVCHQRRNQNGKVADGMIQCELCFDFFHVTCVQKHSGCGGSVYYDGLIYLCGQCGRSSRPFLRTLYPIVAKLSKDRDFYRNCLEMHLLDCFVQRCEDFEKHTKSFVNSDQFRNLKNSCFSKAGDVIVERQFDVITCQKLEDLVCEGLLLEVTFTQMQPLLELHRQLNKPNAQQFTLTKCLARVQIRANHRETPAIAVHGAAKRKTAYVTSQVNNVNNKRIKSTVTHKFKKDEDDDDGDYHTEGDQCSAPNCLLPTGDNLHWIQCEGICALWYHILCVGLSENQVRSIDKYYCFHCKTLL